MTATPPFEALIEAIRRRTENYYDAHGLCCSEAILFVINRAFAGGLNDPLVRRLGAGFCGGMGGGEGACGALTGATAALGLILGPGQRHGLPKAKMRQATQRLHDSFRSALHSTVCQVLTAPHAGNRGAKIKSCQGITGLGAALCARIILDCRPKLANQVDLDFINRHDSKARALVKKIVNSF